MLFNISFKINYFNNDIFLIMPLKMSSKNVIEKCQYNQLQSNTVNLESLERPPTVLIGLFGFITEDEAHL